MSLVTTMLTTIAGGAQSFTSITVDNLTPSRAVTTDASKMLTSSVVTDTELSCLSGITSSVQAQLNTKITSSSVDTLTNKVIDADSNTITNIENSDIKNGAGIALNKLASTTASRALVSDSSGYVSASSVTSTELGYVSGVTSAIQTQLDAKLTASISLPYFIIGGNFYVSAGPLVQAYPPGNQAGWSFTNQGSTSLTTFGTGSDTAFYMQAPRSATDSVRLYGYTTAAASYTITAAVMPLFTTFSIPQAGIGFYNAGNGRLMTLAVTVSTTALQSLNVTKWSSVTGFNSNAFSLNIGNNMGIFWMRIAFDGTNLFFSLSTDGNNFIQVFTEAAGTFLGSTSYKVGLVINAIQGTNTQPVGATLLSWKQVNS